MPSRVNELMDATASDQTNAGALGPRDPSLDVSIVIVNWNAVDLLRACLASIHRAIGSLGYEVIVVDNASRDDSVVMVTHEFPEVRIVLNPRNVGFAAANNQGLAQARGRYLLLLNNDTVVLAGAIGEMVRYMDAHPGVGALGPRLCYEDGSLQVSVYPFPRLVHDALVILHINRWPLVGTLSRRYGRRRDVHLSAQTGEVDWVMGACLLLRREALEHVGVLDDDYFFGAEEMDLCYRLWESGWPVVYLTEAEIVHLGGRSRERVPAAHLIWYYTTKLRFYRLHCVRWQYLVLRAAMALSAAGSLSALLLSRPQSADNYSLRAAYASILVHALRGQ